MKTNRFGMVTLRLRPTRKGRVVFTARKSGYVSATRLMLVK